MDGLSGSFRSGKARESYVSALVVGAVSFFENADRTSDVLQGLFAPILKAKGQAAMQLVENLRRYADAPRFGDLLQANGHVYAVSVKIAVGTADDVSKIDADPE